MQAAAIQRLERTGMLEEEPDADSGDVEEGTRHHSSAGTLQHVNGRSRRAPPARPATANSEDTAWLEEEGIEMADLSYPQAPSAQPLPQPEQTIHGGQQQLMYAGQIPAAQPVGGGHVAYAQSCGQQPRYQQPHGGDTPAAQCYSGQTVAHIPNSQAAPCKQPEHSAEAAPSEQPEHGAEAAPRQQQDQPHEMPHESSATAAPAGYVGADDVAPNGRAACIGTAAPAAAESAHVEPVVGPSDARSFSREAVDGNCVVCLEKTATITLIHGLTGHTCVCNSCAETLVKAQTRAPLCPICREPVEQLVRVF